MTRDPVKLLRFGKQIKKKYPSGLNKETGEPPKRLDESFSDVLMQSRKGPL